MNTTKLFFSGIDKKDLEVFRLLYEMYYSVLCCLSHRIVSSHEDAENIVTSVFMDLWEERNNPEILTGIKPILCKAVFQKSIKLLNSHNPGSQTSLEPNHEKSEVSELLLKLI